MNQRLTVYIAASFRHLHGVRLLGDSFRKAGCDILDWTLRASPPPGLTSAQRRIWMDTDQNGGQVYSFCRTACLNAELVVYYGASGQDAGVEIGIAHAAGTPILGIAGPLESPGLMLHGAVAAWVESVEIALETVRDLAIFKSSAFMMPEKQTNPAFAILAPVLKRKIIQANESGHIDAGCSGR